MKIFKDEGARPKENTYRFSEKVESVTNREVGPGEVGRQEGPGRGANTPVRRVTNIALNTLAQAPMVDRRAVGVGPAGPLGARVAAGVVCQLAVLDVQAIIVLHALQDGHADAAGSEFHAGRTLAGLAVPGGDEALGAVADAAASDQDEAQFGGTTDAVALKNMDI